MASDGYHRGYVSFAHFLLYFFHILRIAPKSRAKVCVKWRIFKPPGSLLATDRSKAVVLV